MYSFRTLTTKMTILLSLCQLSVMLVPTSSVEWELAEWIAIHWAQSLGLISHLAPLNGFFAHPPAPHPGRSLALPILMCSATFAVTFAVMSAVNQQALS